MLAVAPGGLLKSPARDVLRAIRGDDADAGNTPLHGTSIPGRLRFDQIQWSTPTAEPHWTAPATGAASQTLGQAPNPSARDPLTIGDVIDDLTDRR